MRESILPRQSPSSWILASILSDGDSPFCNPFVFMLIAWSSSKLRGTHVTSALGGRSTWYDRLRPRNVTDERSKHGTVRRAAQPDAGHRLPHARLVQQGGRRGPGNLAALP